MDPLTSALGTAAEAIRTCSRCGNIDAGDPCGVCRDPKRDGTVICVVEEVVDLWALERSSAFRGLYHVLGGTLSALDGKGPEDLNIASLVARTNDDTVKEVILATSATVDGQTTAHYITDRMATSGTKVSGIAHGVPVGGELDYLDDGTLSAALRDRHPI